MRATTGCLFTIIALLLALTVGCSEEWHGRKLTGPEIQGLFAGKTVTGYHEKHGYSFESYYESTGTFRSYQGGSKTPRHGKWSVENGDNICVLWLDTSERLCRHMVTDDKGRYWKVLFKPGGTRVLIVTFHSFEPGNTKGL